MDFLTTLFPNLDTQALLGRFFTFMFRFMEIFFPANAPAAFPIDLDA